MWDDGATKNTRQHSAVWLALEPVQASQWHLWDQEKVVGIWSHFSPAPTEACGPSGLGCGRGALDGLSLLSTWGYLQQCCQVSARQAQP